MMSKINNTKEDKQKLKDYYEQWRHLNQNEKDSDAILKKIGEISELIEKDDFVFVSNFQIRIAYTFSNTGNFEIAEKYFFKVLKGVDLLTNHKDILETTYEGLGDIYFRKKQYNKACEFYIKLLDIADIDEYIEDDLLQMGIAFLKNSNTIYLNKSEELLTDAFEMADEIMDSHMIAKSSYYLGIVKYKLLNYSEAKTFLEKALIKYKQYNWDCKKIYRMLNNIEDSYENRPSATDI